MDRGIEEGGRNGTSIVMHGLVKPFAAAFAAVMIVAAPASAQVQERIPSLNASGEGYVMVAPDIAIVTIGVTTRGETARAALDQNSAETARVIAAIPPRASRQGHRHQRFRRLPGV